MRTLYVSDLDGTLLRSDERTSGYTNRTVNRLVGEGMLFSYATARSFQTARKVTAGLEAEIPLIVYNGAAVADNRDGSFLQMDFFGGEAAEILDELEACGVFPIVYAVAGGRESVHPGAVAGDHAESGLQGQCGPVAEKQPRMRAAGRVRGRRK